jgi:hypothetical protein
MSTIVQSPQSKTAITLPLAVIAAGAEEAFLRGQCPPVDLQFEAVGMTFTITADEVAAGRAAIQAALSTRAGSQCQLPEAVAHEVTELGLIAYEQFSEAVAAARETAPEFLAADAERAALAAATTTEG